MLKLMDKKILTILYLRIILSGPLYSAGLYFCDLVLVYLSHWLIVSYCDHWMLVMHRPSSTIASKDIFSLTNGWILTNLGRNDPYMALFKNCSNGSGLLHI